jgi:fatty acid synthase, animal type
MKMVFPGPQKESVRVSRDCQYFPGVKRPIWFVFSGMGSQWSGMAKDLMKIPTFAAAIQK